MKNNKMSFSEFWKNYSYAAVKLLVTQIVLAIFGMTLAISTGKSRTLQLIVSIFAVLFYLVMVYTDMFKLGSQDAVRIEGDRREYDSLTGLKIAALAAVPDLILCILNILTVFPDGSLPSRIGAFAQMIHLWIQGAYTGILATRIGDVPMNTLWWAHFLIIIPLLLVAFAAYYAGVNDKRFTKVLIPENPEEKEIRREKDRLNK
ncbi:MAG: hypothetical protein MJ137_07645 [Clostridia bacterium]|nr:hypothetical protein [Clostridia bacterium]